MYVPLDTKVFITTLFSSIDNISISFISTSLLGSSTSILFLAYSYSFFRNSKVKEQSIDKVDEKNVPDLNNYAFDFNADDKKKESNNKKQENTNIISNDNKNDEDEPLEEIIKKEPIEISLNNNINIIKENIDKMEF